MYNLSWFFLKLIQKYENKREIWSYFDIFLKYTHLKLLFLMISQITKCIDLFFNLDIP